MNGASRSTARAGRLKDILQLSLKTQPIRPVPQVGQVELKVRILDDTDHVIKVCRTAGLELEKDQIFWTHNGE